MSQYINKIRTDKGDLQIDYNALANLPTISNPNLLINGDFQIWQRGESFSNIANKYTADRWKIKNAKGNTSLVERSTDIPSGEFLRQSVHIKETLEENTYLSYNFENALKGTFTLSFWYKTSSEFHSYIYDNSVLVHLGKLTTLNAWTKATFTFTATAMTFINVIHAMSAGDCYIAGVKLEYGDIATVLMPRLGAEELALCQRYYVKLKTIYPLMIAQRNNAGTSAYMFVPLPVTLRNAPSITFVNAKTMKNGLGGSFYDLTDVTCVGVCDSGVTLQVTAAENFEAGIPYFLILPESGYINFDAEIY